VCCAQEDKQQAIANVLSKADAAKDAELQSLQNRMAQEMEARVEEVQLRHAEQIRQLEDKYQSQLATAQAQAAERERFFERQVEKELETLREALQADKEAALASLQELMTAKVNNALADTENYKQLFYEESAARKQIHNRLIELQGNIRVLCRVRPIVEVEEQSGEGGSVVDFPDEDTLTVTNTKNNDAVTQRFEFDRVFSPGSTQAEVFEAVQPLVVSVLDGYNVCIFA
jgi:hypothetical protein